MAPNPDAEQEGQTSDFLSDGTGSRITNFAQNVPLVKRSSTLKIQWQQCLNFPLQIPTTSHNLVKLSRNFSKLSSISAYVC